MGVCACDTYSGLLFKDLTTVWSADLGVRVRPCYIDDELAVANDAGEVTVFRKLERESWA